MSDPDFRLTAGLSGRYRIERLLGSGGMATVHLAQDLRHDRKVALKVLRPELAAAIGAERFLQEIRTTAGLQHPHILGLIDSGETEGQLWYAMPFVPGESLRERLNREQQLPVEDALRLATEVAGALDYAHRQGVIHRDIKPENILLHDGAALVVDFGIALAATGASQRLTSTGLSIGTPQYMSPEQAAGERQLTPRSDVYSLGCVVYEMLMGQPPFTGPTAQAVIAATLAAEAPRLSPRRRSVPVNVEAAVLKALEKLPADRFSAAEFAKALADPGFRSGTHPLEPSGRSGRIVALAGLALAASVAWLAIQAGRVRTPPAVPLMRFGIPLPDHGAWMDDDGSGMALSPDGMVLAYTGRDSAGGRRLYLRPMNQTDPVPVGDGATGAMPFFSPDGQWLGFIRGGLHRVPLSGGPAENLCGNLLGYVHATWLEDGSIVFADGGPQGLQQCHPGGEVTTMLAGDSVTFNFPHGLPGDRGLVFTVRRGGVDRLAVLDRRTGAWRALDIIGTSPRFVEPGSLAFVGPDAGLSAVPFDLDRLSITGPATVVQDQVAIGATGAALMAVSRTGVLVTASRGLSDQSLELVSRDGRADRLHPRVGRFLDPRVSPDGARIAVGLDGEIWLLDRGQGTLDRLTSDALASRPAWTPDGQRIGYVRQVGRTVDLRVVQADGGAPPESLLARLDRSLWEVAFPADGRSMVFRVVGGPGLRDIWLAPGDTATPIPIVATPANEVAPAVSPDGRWLAYTSDESGRYEVYVRPFPQLSTRHLVSLEGGTEPVWSRDGRELYYRRGPVLTAATVRTSPDFEVSERTPLFSDGTFYADPTHATYDVTADARHFVMTRMLGSQTLLTVTLNAFQPQPVGTSKPR